MVDMGSISSEIKTADIISVNPLEPTRKGLISKIIKEKLNRDIELKDQTDTNIGGGIIVNHVIG